MRILAWTERIKARLWLQKDPCMKDNQSKRDKVAPRMYLLSQLCLDRKNGYWNDIRQQAKFEACQQKSKASKRGQPNRQKRWPNTHTLSHESAWTRRADPIEPRKCLDRESVALECGANESQHTYTKTQMFVGVNGQM